MDLTVVLPKESCSKQFKLGLSPSKKVGFVCFNESPLKMIKNAFYFILKVLFVHKIFNFCPGLFGHLGRRPGFICFDNESIFSCKI